MHDAEAEVRGERISNSLLDRVAQLASEAAKPISDVYGSAGYKREMVRVLARDNLTDAVKRAQAE